MKRLALLVVLAGCVSAVPHPGERELASARLDDPGATLGLLEHGRDKYIARCSGCHSLPEPSSHSRDGWHSALDEMSERAKLSPDDRRSIELYLRAETAR